MPAQCLSLVQYLAGCLSQKAMLLDAEASDGLDPWVAAWNKELLEYVDTSLLC